MKATKAILGAAMLVALLPAAQWAKADSAAPNPFRSPEYMAAHPVAAVEEVPTPTDPVGKPMQSLGVSIALPEGRLPEDEAQWIESTAPLAGSLPRPWPSQVYNWEAAATRHQPLYFEEINAERYGYSRNWVAQPFISTAHFFATIPALPYLKTANCPWECQYTLGHYRPGSCPPYRRHCWPCDCPAAAVEAGTIAGLILLLP